MQASEILELIDKYPFLKTHFDGVYSLDQLPKKLSYRHFIIVNFDTSDLPGSHWFVISRPLKHTYLEVFDSLTLSEFKIKQLKIFWRFKLTRFECNETILQENDSDTCGYFCLYYVLNRCYNYDLDFQTFLSSYFSSIPSENEILVKEFFENV